MKIKLASVPVLDQKQALQFYTETLGFVKKTDIPMGEVSFLTVVSPELPGEVELLLEPMGFEPAIGFQAQLKEAGIPWTAFEVDDIGAEYRRLTELGVQFKSEPSQMGDVTVAIFDDTCGNLISIYQKLT